MGHIEVVIECVATPKEIILKDLHTMDQNPPLCPSNLLAPKFNSLGKTLLYKVM